MPWHNLKENSRGVVRIEAPAARLLPTYKLRALEPAFWPCENSARLAARGAYWEIVFQDAADVIPSNAWTRIFGKTTIDGTPPLSARGFDHELVWKSRRSRLYLITVEPYNDAIDQAAETCRSHGWDYHVFPDGVGMWNPAEHLGTRLLLASPGDLGLPLGMVLPKLQRALKAWEIESDANA